MPNTNKENDTQFIPSTSTTKYGACCTPYFVDRCNWRTASSCGSDPYRKDPRRPTVIISTTTTEYYFVLRTESIYSYTTASNTPYLPTQQNLIYSYHSPCLEGALSLLHRRIHCSAQCLPEQQRAKARVHRSNVTPPAAMATIQEGLGPYHDREYILEAAAEAGAGVGVQVPVGIKAEHLVHLRVLTTANQEARRSGSLTLPSCLLIFLSYIFLHLPTYPCSLHCQASDMTLFADIYLRS